METHITVVLDSSGSMQAIKADTIGGFNGFLEEQRAESGTATVSCYEFDTTVETRNEVTPLENAPSLTAETYTPGGRTALHDAMVTAIDGTQTHLGAPTRETAPETVIVVVLTDGKENASGTPQEVVRDRVTACQNNGWEFLFIGANQDAALTAEGMGIDADQSLTMAHSGEGARAAYESTSEQISQARREGSVGGYTDDDRRRQDEAERSE